MNELEGVIVFFTGGGKREENEEYEYVDKGGRSERLFCFRRARVFVV